MKKRMMGILLALSLCLTLLPGTAFAAYKQTEISEVSVSVTAPTVGADLTASMPTVASNQPYYIAESSWTRVAAEGCAANLDYWGSRSETFENNSWYLLRVKLLLDYGYTYGKNVTANGLNATKTEVERYRDDTVYVSAWFKVGTPADAANIDSISISSVPTERREKISDWKDDIEKATIRENCKLSYVTIYVWDSEKDCWDVCYSSDTTDSSKVYGAGLTVNTFQGYVFADNTTVTVDDKTAEIMERRADEIEVFVPFGKVAIGNVEVSSDTWPIEGNTINKSSDNFSIGGDGYVGYTLESAKFQIKKNESWTDLTEDETKFSKSNDYCVIAVLKAKDYAAFAKSVKGDFNGTGKTVECAISDNGKTCTITRTCKVYDPIYTYEVGDTTKRTNGVGIYRPDPKAGEMRVLGEFAPTAGQVKLAGAKATVGWYEVPYVGSTTQIKQMGENDKFEEGKAYLSTLSLSYLDASSGEKNNGIAGYRFGEGFTVSFKQLDGSDSKYARMECTRDTAKSKQYNIWYTVGDVTQQAVTNVAITSPEPENGTIDTENLSKFTATGGVTIVSASYLYNRLSFTLQPRSGYYFGRTVTVTYNNKAASVSNSGISDLRFDIKYASVDYTAAPATPITVTGITAKNKTYDGTTSAELDVSYAVLNDIEAGDDVSLDLAGVTAVFADKNVGTGKTVSVTGQFRLTGKDANKYALTQPARTLTADIAAASFTDATNKTQTIYVGESSFEAPRFTGVTVNGKAEEVTGDTAYTGGGETKTVAEIGEALKTLKAGEHLEISYSFTATDSNYSNDAKPGAITVTAQNRPSSGSSSSPSYSITLPDKTELGTVTANRRYAERGDTVTITVKPDSGYVLEALTATDRNGEELTLTDLGDGKYTFTMPSGKVEVKATFMEDNSLLNLFYDVPNGAYYYEAVKRAVEKDITNGIGNSLFGPNAPCTRTQIVTFLWRAAGSPEPKNAGSFSDVPSGGYYAKAVAWAAENGITTGVGGGRFAPDDTCTRAQAVALLARALNAKAEGSASFSDVPADSYYAGAVKWAADNGVTEGIGGGLFGPADDCTRAQIVTFLYRAYNK